ncbi:response regulator transcription factor [Shewanella frigidimarina]|uniref:Transcriptional regulator, LuxR family n=1 Tax=Shewanella frigidimarina (strain NCIMB 400) TaxID=318167 RepID=Q087Z4_SHEFN|nr:MULTISPECIES: response regulator transcription factor [Shewanella]ABI70421.1 transcriptional regulator, LuxR family [Shewanella frigidimarina NCIMB 400]MBB1425912.1 response regulator transcription factor [Shewanella sp. SG44-2]PKH98799.1 DNA-binding response regulator [Shewanella sp. 11B5]RPA30486.1 DNA-binding response regulator [Shewanella frigidimarina]RPA60265.1 DNA-binding response regulator [Shewanella frigidimarina]|tara:strand:+ start:1205 stop:1873 length:669 start_codon:yes stop_codon:yes gene_type:complete
MSSNIDELVFLHQIAAPCHLAILAESIGLKTRIVKHAAELELEKKSNNFYLVSQKGAALDSKGIPLLVSRLVEHVPVALYQVERGSLDQESALLLGVRGLLYSDQRMDLMLTGLRKMVSDELWYDRPLISKIFRRLVQQLDTSAEIPADTVAILQRLTSRERTIIQLVSSGARNKEIAQRLCISEHTVKAHISSIFRKTESRNRVELLRWAQTYQSHCELVS